MVKSVHVPPPAGFPQGTIVAVKVRHPGVGAAIARDFGTMMWVAGVLDGWNLLGDIKLGETLKQFAAPLREQVDLAREASHLQRFNHNFRKAKAVHFPVPLYPLVRQDNHRALPRPWPCCGVAHEA